MKKMKNRIIILHTIHYSTAMADEVKADTIEVTIDANNAKIFTEIRKFMRRNRIYAGQNLKQIIFED
jgi:hypothetical protein